LVRRLIYTIILLFFVIILNWVIFQALPGQQGGFETLIQPGKTTEAQRDALIRLYGLNESYTTRFFDYVKAMLTFTFGYSFQTGQQVSTEIVQSGRLVNTLVLLGSSSVVSIIIGILAGILAARKRGSSFDNISVTASLTTFSLPTFWMGTLLIIVFAIGFKLFPTGGTVPLAWESYGYPSNLLVEIGVRLQYLFLPALTLTLFTYGGFLLLTRATMMEALGEDYIVTARAKGLSERAILLRHAFKNASLPIVTATALQFGFILSGAIITETIFNWNGLGFWLFQSLEFKDFPVIQAMFYIIALMVIAANFISDVIYGIIDPRIRYE
jgi:peptide/nickel transport system permease protein